MGQDKKLVLEGTNKMEIIDSENLRTSYDYRRDVVYCYLYDAPYSLRGVYTEGSTNAEAKRLFVKMLISRMRRANRKGR